MIKGYQVESRYTFIIYVHIETYIKKTDEVLECENFSWFLNSSVIMFQNESNKNSIHHTNAMNITCDMNYFYDIRVLQNKITWKWRNDKCVINVRKLYIIECVFSILTLKVHKKIRTSIADVVSKDSCILDWIKAENFVPVNVNCEQVYSKMQRDSMNGFNIITIS